MTDHGKPIYTFSIRRKDTAFTQFISRLFLGLGVLIFVCTIIHLISGTVRLHDCIAAFMVSIPFMGLGFLTGYIVRKDMKTEEIVTCYDDGIDTTTNGFIPRDKLVSIDFFHPIGSKSQGTLWIRTSLYLRAIYEHDAPHFRYAYILADVPDVEDIYQKIKTCYSLPHEDFRTNMADAVFHSDKKILKNNEIPLSRVAVTRGKKEFNDQIKTLVVLFFIFASALVLMMVLFMSGIRYHFN